MKTTILTAAMIILMTNASVWASDDSVSVSRYEDQAIAAIIKLQPSKVIEFRVVNPDPAKLTFKIYGEKNNKIYQRTLKSEDGIRFGCDMKDFNNGTYVCVIEKEGYEISRRTITLK